MNELEPDRSETGPTQEDKSHWAMRLFLAWGIFNPNGPTLCVIGIREDPSVPMGEVVFMSLHFTGATTQILGSIDLGRADAKAALAATLKRAFAVPVSTSPVTTIPSFVVSALPDEPAELAQALFRAAPALHDADWGRELDLLRRHGPRLFDRAGEELRRTMRALREEGGDPDSLRFLELRYLRVLEGDHQDPKVAPFAPFSNHAFEAWWEVTEQVDYLRTALFQFAGAWVGARHVSGISPHETLAFESLRDFMAGRGLPLWPGDLSSAELKAATGITEEPEATSAIVPSFGIDSMFPLTDVAHYLAAQGVGLDYQEDGFSWHPGSHAAAEIKVMPLHFTADDGFLVTEQANLVLRAGWASGCDDETLDQWNQFAAITGFARDPWSGEVILTSKVGVPDGDGAAAAMIYAPIISLAAAGMTWVAERFARSDFSVSPEHSPYAGEEDEPPVESGAFVQALKAVVEPRGFVGTVDSGSLTFEIPWDAGALTQMARISSIRESLQDVLGLDEHSSQDLAGRTALVQIRTDTRHPWFGRGVHCTLELPLSPHDPGVFELVRDLNTWELQTPDLPPYFGAWVVGPRAPMFTTFVPNQLCLPGLVTNLAAWSAGRGAQVRRWLNSEGARS